MGLRTGTRFGQHEIVGLLGAGGMGACSLVSERSESSRLVWGWGPMRA